MTVARYRWHSFAALLLATAALALMTACNARPAAQSAPIRASEIDVALSTPEEAARSALRLIQAELRARRAGDEAEADRIRDRMREVTSAKGIEDRFTANPRYRTIVGDDPVMSLADLWGASIAYYAEGIDFSTLRADPRLAQRDAQQTDLLVQARGKDDDATIRIRCHRDPDGLWRVLQVSFDAPGAIVTTRPISSAQPAATKPAATAPSGKSP